MTKHTEALPPLPAGSIDFDKVHAACKQGHSDPFKGAVSHERGDELAEPAETAKAADDSTSGKTE